MNTRTRATIEHETYDGFTVDHVELSDASSVRLFYSESVGEHTTIDFHGVTDLTVKPRRLVHECGEHIDVLRIDFTDRCGVRHSVSMFAADATVFRSALEAAAVKSTEVMGS